MPSMDFSNFSTGTLPLAALAASTVLLSLFALSTWKSPNSKLPPGPPGKWIIGNALDIPKEQEWLGWDRLRREYGPLVSLKVFGQLIVVLGDPRMITQLLEKRSAISSGRPIFVLSGEILEFKKLTVGSQHNAAHKEARRIFNQTIGKAHVHKYETLVADEMIKMVGKMMDSNGDKDEVISAIRHAVGAVVIGITYGIKTEKRNDRFIQYAEDAVSPFIITTKPAAFSVDILPILQYAPSWFPGATYKKQLPLWRKQIRKLLDEPVEVVKKELSQGIQKTSVAHEIFAQADMTKEQEERLKWAATSIYFGGSDTSYAAFHVFVLAMTRYPEVQRKAQLEVDNVVGTGRFPTMKDRPSMPYVHAILKETLRWHPVTPQGGPRMLTEDELFEGYVLPKGTVLVVPLWGLLHDESFFSDPMEFIPERWLDTEERGPHTAKLERVPVFKSRNFSVLILIYSPSIFWGWGKRTCPGKDLVDMQLWLAIASTLATLNISPRGTTPPPATFHTGILSHPTPFDCTIRPRDDRAEAMVKNAVASIS